jgi:hypothetical protein
MFTYSHKKRISLHGHCRCNEGGCPFPRKKNLATSLADLTTNKAVNLYA